MRAPLLYLAGFLTAAGGLPNDFRWELARDSTAFSVRASRQPAFDQIDQGNIARASDGLFYVQAGVGEQRLRFLVDTGATHVVLSRADAKRVAYRPISDEASSIQTAGGAVAVDWVVIDEIEIAGALVRGVRAAVPRQDIEVSLLGQNALAQFSQLHFNGDRLIMRR